MSFNSSLTQTIVGFSEPDKCSSQGLPEWNLILFSLICSDSYLRRLDLKTKLVLSQ